MIRQISTPADLSGTDLSNKFALDSKGLAELRQGARANSPEATKAAATQFEAMFVNMMLKSMRDATPQDGLLDSQQTKMFTTMMDQQTSQTIARKGIGLADVLVRQLSKSSGIDPAAAETELPDGGFTKTMLDAARLQRSIDAAGGSTSTATSTTTTPSTARHAHVRAFQDKLSSHAEAASRATGIPAKFMLGQAALESGWGRREIKGADGTNSNNLFGIKAGGDWKGKTVDVMTTEYVNGKAQRKVERFRAYDSYADSFKDYARLITENPRYEKVLASAGDPAAFAKGLQKAGYATDPNYAAKLAAVINKTLG